MVGKGNLVVFESSNISETRMATPIKIGVHAQYIDLYLHFFFEPIQKIELILNVIYCFYVRNLRAMNFRIPFTITGTCPVKLTSCILTPCVSRKQSELVS